MNRYDNLAAFVGLVKIALAEPLRDKIAYFWTLAQPLFAIAFIAASAGGLALDAAAVARYGLYICFVNSSYTTGATLLWKRESGVLRAFARTAASRRRLIMVQIVASMIYATIFCCFLLALLAAINSVGIGLLACLSIVCAGLVASLLGSLASLLILRTQLSFANASAAMNIYAFALAVMTFFIGPQVSYFAVIQSFNPVSLFSALLFSPLTHDQHVGVMLLSAIWALVCISAGYLGISHFRIRPSTLR
jgi:hypothetical protein